MKVSRKDCYTQNKNNMPLFFNYLFRRDDFYYWSPPPPFERWEERGTYIKINDNIYAEGAYKTFSSYEFIVNKRGGESGKVIFNYPVDYIRINDRVEYYLKGKLKFVGFVEYVDGASKELSIIPAWGKLNYQYFAGDSIEEAEQPARKIVFDMKPKIETMGIIWKDENITIEENTFKLKTNYSGKSVIEILEEVEDLMSANWCFGVDFNNEFYFKEIDDKPKKTINYFENHFSESEYELDTSNLVTRYICKIKSNNGDTSGTRTLPVIVGSEETLKYPPISLEQEIGIKVDTYEVDAYYSKEQYDLVYERAYKLLNNQIKSEVVKLKNINFNNIDIDFNEAVKIIMKPENNYYNDTSFEEPVYNAYESNNLYSSEILQINIDIDKEIIPNYKQANEINLYDIDLGYRKMTLKSYALKKIFIYYSIGEDRDATGIFVVTDGEKTQRKYCIDGFGEFDIQGYDKIKLKIINERSNVIYNKITVFFDVGVREFSMNARTLTYSYNNNSLSVEGQFAKMNVKLTNYLFMLENNIKRTGNIINNA